MGVEGAVLLDLDEPLAVPVPLPPRGHDAGTATLLANGRVLLAGGGSTCQVADLYVGAW